MRSRLPHATLPSMAPAVGRLAALATALMLGACAQSGDGGLGLGLGAPKEAPAETLAAGPGSRPANELEKATDYWAKEAAKNPRDINAVLSYVRNLKALGRKQEALAALQGSYLFAADNREYLSEYGRLALDLGQVSTAATLLERADDPAKPDWRVISARGTSLAKQGDYKGAIRFFERARELAPSQASVMNNLAMAYTMDGQAEKAEQLLRQATQQGGDDPRVRQNLALVLGLQGRHQEARALGGETPTDAPVAAAGAEPQPQEPKNAAAAEPVQPARAVARTRAPAAEPVAASKPMDPDDIIRAAIEADLARNMPAAAPKARKREATTAAADTVPALRPAKP